MDNHSSDVSLVNTANKMFNKQIWISMISFVLKTNKKIEILFPYWEFRHFSNIHWTKHELGSLGQLKERSVYPASLTVFFIAFSN